MESLATVPTSAVDLHQEPLADFVLIRTADIVVGERLRPVDPVWAEALGQIMLREGQRTPVEVCRLPGQRCWTLVAGGHRHAGAVFAEIEFMRAEIVTADRDERRSREISENLWRDDLAPMDRAAFIAEAVAIQKRRAGIDPLKDGRAISAAARWQKQIAAEAEDATATIAVAYNLTQDLVGAIGLSARTIRDDLMLHRRVPTSLVEKLRADDHQVFYNFSQLKALAKLEEREQVKVVELLTVPGASLNYEQPKTISEAIAHPLGPKPAERSKPDAETKRLSAFLGAFGRMGVVERRAALSQLEPQLPPGTDISNVERPKARFSPDHERYRDETLEALDHALLMLDGMEEDGLIPASHHVSVSKMIGDLRIARMTVAGNGFDMSEGHAS